MKAPKKKEENFLIRLSDKDRQAIERKARRHASGNVSAWIRYASQLYIPQKHEKVPIPVSARSRLLTR